MARYTATVDSPHAPSEVFAYLSDFSSAEEWDPGVVEAERLDDAPVTDGQRVSARDEISTPQSDAHLPRRRVPPAEPVTFRGVNSSVVSMDRITFEPWDGGTRVTYDAVLVLKGPLRIADPLLALAFNRVGDRALAGMRRTLQAEQLVP